MVTTTATIRLSNSELMATIVAAIKGMKRASSLQNSAAVGNNIVTEVGNTVVANIVEIVSNDVYVVITGISVVSTVLSEGEGGRGGGRLCNNTTGVSRTIMTMLPLA